MKKAYYKALALVGGVMSSLGLFAEGQQATMPTFQSQVVTDFGQSLQTSLAELVNWILPIAGAVLGGALILWGVVTLVRVAKRAFSAGSGR